MRRLQGTSHSDSCIILRNDALRRSVCAVFASAAEPSAYHRAGGNITRAGGDITSASGKSSRAGGKISRAVGNITRAGQALGKRLIGVGYNSLARPLMLRLVKPLVS